MEKKMKDEFLDRIKEPKVREYYEAKLQMAEEIEGLRTGGIFDVPGVDASSAVAGEIELPPDIDRGTVPIGWNVTAEHKALVGAFLNMISARLGYTIELDYGKHFTEEERSWLEARLDDLEKKGGARQSRSRLAPTDIVLIAVLMVMALVGAFFAFTSH